MSTQKEQNIIDFYCDLHEFKKRHVSNEAVK